MRSYRIWETGSSKNMKLDDVADLTPGEREIVVDVQAAGVGFVDALVVAGKYQNVPATPFAPGMEFAGTVRAVGPGVSNCAPGDRVTAYTLSGGFAEQAIARVGEFFPVPDEIPLEQAAIMCGSYLTAYFALTKRGHLAAGESVLVGGAGGAVGLAAIQITRALKAKTIVGTYRSQDDRQAILDAGADVAIDISGQDIKDTLRAQVQSATGGDGIDLVIDPVGGDFFQAALRTVVFSGRVIVLGFAAGEIPSVKVNYLLLKNIGVLGLDVSQYKTREPTRVEEAQRELFRLWKEGKLAPRVARRFRFEETPDAIDFVAQGRTGGRAVIAIRKDR